ncbi:MAG: Trk system potassium transporter TrkA [Chromatiales bacterium]|nr:Trk system potassium transporter TrkA [Chromatiales bacterium]
MKVIVLGANHLGISLALNLAEENNDVTLVDKDFRLFQDIQSVFDLRTIVGQGSHPDILQQADAENADMLIALNDHDEENIIACRIAHTLFDIPTKIAKVTTRGYLEEKYKLFGKDAIPIDVLVSPELSVAKNIKLLIEHPGTLQIAELGGGQLFMVCAKAHQNGAAVGRTTAQIVQSASGATVHIAALFRNEKISFTDEQTVIQAGDEVFFLAPKAQIAEIMKTLGCDYQPLKTIMIAGGGQIGMNLAELLQNDYKIKLLEPDIARATMLAERLGNKVVVLHSDATNENILIDENIKRTDMMCAVTSKEEDNILSALLCKHLGANQVLALINRPSYLELVHLNHVNIDITLSPQQAAFASLLCHVRKGDTVATYTLKHSDAEVIELVVHGDARSSKVVGRPLSRIRLPTGVKVGMILRGEQVFTATPELVIESEDHVIVFVDSKKHIPNVEKLFMVTAIY